jgi:bifunctional UDP-N-acetylglucosamine pyrophosphorylase/glucosamine-1-phosphate N-acetyltransferase
MEMALHPVNALCQAEVERIALVVSEATEERLRESLGDTVEYVLQPKPTGTGDALSRAIPKVQGRSEHVLVVNGDMTLVRPETLQAMKTLHLASQAAVTFLTVHGPLAGMGRVVRDEQGKFLRVVEEAEMNETEAIITEVNAGAYCFRMDWLAENIRELRTGSVGEVYITDLLGLAVSQEAGAEAFVLDDPQEALGVNNRVELSRAEGVLRKRICERWMLAGVTVRDPATTFIDAMVELGQDTVLEPGSMLLGSTRVGSNCVVGPNAVIRDSRISDDCEVVSSSLEEATLEAGCDVGPYSHLRSGTHLERDVHVGTSAEIKNSHVGQGSHVGHFSYIGDARLGNRVNIGAGTVTCNYDGVRKSKTEIGDDTFVGSDTMLIAPVVIGPGAKIGAGAVVTRDIPAGSLAIGVPAKVVRGEGAKPEV